MAYDIAMNVSTGDVVIQNGDLVLIDNAERVAQQILITLREWLGEWFLDTRDGMPYIEYILVKNPNENHIRQILMEKIGSVEGVSSVTSMTLAMNNFSRTLAVEYEAETAYGLVKRKELLGYARN